MLLGPLCYDYLNAQSLIMKVISGSECISALIVEHHIRNLKHNVF